MFRDLDVSTRSRRPLSRFLGRFLLGAFALAALAAALLGLALFVALRAAPGEWSRTVQLGPARVDIGVLALIRIATHPLGLRALHGRSVPSSIGTLRFATDPVTDTLQIFCEPCRVDEPALSSAPLRLPRVEWTVRRTGANDLHGDMTVGKVRATWQAALRSRDLGLVVTLADAPVADVYAIFDGAIPELARARIEGRFGGELRLDLPSRRAVVKPRLEGLVVGGLGTEALLGAPLPACARPTRRADAAAPFGAWLPKAGVAAEDPRFFEHPGYDPAELAAAWASPGAGADAARAAAGPAPPRVAGRLSQRLARLLYTGDERALASQLRELLYTVELERTLGKARVLALYLSIAPWGAERCGAEAAAQHGFGKRAATLDPIEAAWLASLLRDPDAELRRAASSGFVDRPRLEAILAGMHPLTRPRRKALTEELRGWSLPMSSATR